MENQNKNDNQSPTTIIIFTLSQLLAWIVFLLYLLMAQSCCVQQVQQKQKQTHVTTSREFRKSLHPGTFLAFILPNPAIHPGNFASHYIQGLSWPSSFQTLPCGELN